MFYKKTMKTNPMNMLPKRAQCAPGVVTRFVQAAAGHAVAPLESTLKSK